MTVIYARCDPSDEHADTHLVELVFSDADVKRIRAIMDLVRMSDLNLSGASIWWTDYEVTDCASGGDYEMNKDLDNGNAVYLPAFHPEVTEFIEDHSVSDCIESARLNIHEGGFAFRYWRGDVEYSTCQLYFPC